MPYCRKDDCDDWRNPERTGGEMKIRRFVRAVIRTRSFASPFFILFQLIPGGGRITLPLRCLNRRYVVYLVVIETKLGFHGFQLVPDIGDAAPV